MKPVTVHPDARAEYEAAVAWYEGRTPGCGRDLVDEVNAGLS